MISEVAGGCTSRTCSAHTSTLPGHSHPCQPVTSHSAARFVTPAARPVLLQSAGLRGSTRAVVAPGGSAGAGDLCRDMGRSVCSGALQKQTESLALAEKHPLASTPPLIPADGLHSAVSYETVTSESPNRRKMSGSVRCLCKQTLVTLELFPLQNEMLITE